MPISQIDTTIYDPDPPPPPVVVVVGSSFQAVRGPLRLLWDNLIDNGAVTLTASSATVSVQNIRQVHAGKAWRTGGKTEETLTVDLQSSELFIRCAAVTGFNFTAAATIELQHSTDNVTYTSFPQVVVGDARVIAFFFDLKMSRYWKLIFRDPTNPDGYITIGRVFLGDYWEPVSQVARGWRVELVDETDVERSIGGQKWANERPIFTRVAFRLPALQRDDAFTNFFDIVRRVGLRTDIFMIIDSESSRIRTATGLYGRFVGIPQIRNPARVIYDTSEVVFEESV